MLRPSSSKSVRGRRRHVGDIIVISSSSGVLLNTTEVSEENSGVCDNGDCDRITKEVIAEGIRNSSDVPKIRNRIFEDSLESQEVSFYIDEDPDAFYEKIDLHCDYDSFDSFDEAESDSEHYENHAVISRHNIEDLPLPEPPLPGPNQIEKLTRNIRRIKKNISKDIGKSLRRFSQRMSQIYAEPEFEQRRPPPPPPREEQPAPITNVSNDDKEEPPYANTPTQENTSIFSRIRRSISLSQESALNLTNKIGNQRRSTFYLTEPFDADGDLKTEHIDKSDGGSVVSSPSRAKLVRPKGPPPPAPPTNEDKAPSTDKRSSTLGSQTNNRAKSLYTEAGLFKPHPTRPKSSTAWYTEIGLYSNSSDSSSTSESNIRRFANVISELNSKLSEVSNDKDHHAAKSRNHTVNEHNTNNEKNYDCDDKSESAYINQSVMSANSERENDNCYYNMQENESTYYENSVCSFNSNDSKKDDSSVTYSRNDVKFLEDEPLYQFYDAALLETTYHDDMSEFQSEIYEELCVEEANENYVSSSPKRSTPVKDLISSGQGGLNFNRSLWCEVPEVANSVVLSQLSSQQKKLQEAKFEIITSEASYLNSLNVLNNHFVAKLRHSNIVNEQEMEILFGKIKEVRNCSKKILRDLEKCWKKNILLDGICDIIQKHAGENFDAYIPYCENQVLLGETLSEMKRRSDFRDLLNELESSSTCQFLSLYSFLMLPMQRITRWPLLVDAVLKRLSQADPEYISCQYALASVNQVVSQCNEAARRKEREIELQKITSILEFSRAAPPINIVKENRWLVRSGAMTCFQPRSDDTRMTFGKRFNKFPLHLYLFNDLLLVTKKRSDDAFTVLHYCPRNLIELRDVDMFPVILKKEAQDKNVMYLSILENQDGKIVELLLSCSSESEKERWIEAFSPPKSDNPDETVYECWDCPQVIAVHNYTPCQPDELALTRGDVINVTRKMSDGWYNGERIRDGQTGWFPSNYTAEIINPHVRARNLKQRYRLLTFSEHYLKS